MNGHAESQTFAGPSKVAAKTGSEFSSAAGSTSCMSLGKGRSVLVARPLASRAWRPYRTPFSALMSKPEPEITSYKRFEAHQAQIKATHEDTILPPLLS